MEKSTITIFASSYDAKKVIELFESKFSMNKFPFSIAELEPMKFIFIQSRLFDVKYELQQLYSFLDDIEVDEFYILPADSKENNWQEYEKEHFFNKELEFIQTPVFSINNRPDFNSVEDVLMKKYFINLREYYVFTSKLDWVIHYVPHRNFIILYYDVNLTFKLQTFEEDKIDKMGDLIENAGWGDGFNKNEIEALKTFWFPNYESFNK